MAAAKLCQHEIKRFEKKYSRYRPDSVTSKINRAAGQAPLTIDSETAAILTYAAVCHEQSGGLFDITSGVLRLVWRRGRTTLPDRTELKTCLAKVGWDNVRYSDDEVFLSLPGMELDFGGVIKEYAADAAAVIARNAGIRHGMINLGGDICLVGPQANGEPWVVGIVHPREPGSAIATVPLLEGALTTSGSYERYFEIEGKRWQAILLIHPRTGWPVEGLLSVSVLRDRPLWQVPSPPSRCCNRQPLAWLGWRVAVCRISPSMNN